MRNRRCQRESGRRVPGRKRGAAVPGVGTRGGSGFTFAKTTVNWVNLYQTVKLTYLLKVLKRRSFAVGFTNTR